MSSERNCPDCHEPISTHLNRRQFVQAVGATAVVAAVPSLVCAKGETPQGKSEPENLVQKLYESMTPDQKEEVCFAWDYDDLGGPLRTHVSNNWNITPRMIGSDFYTKDQKDMIEAMFYGLYNKEWHGRIKQQLQDDAGGYGKAQSIAIFGEPGTGKFELVMTGRHLTVRCDGDSTEHTAFGGPIFYGHAAKGFREAADHPGNVFWHQALKANKLYEMLDGKQRKLALVANTPAEREVHFQGAEGKFPGIPVAELSQDQKAHMEDVLKTLVEPYRAKDQEEVAKALKAQGGLDKCSVAFYQSGDIGGDGLWDNWRLEGPSFVWYFRGSPHVHVWVNIADSPDVKITTQG